jgi:hypothetical protein
MQISPDKSEILLNSKIGFEFEFYSNYDVQKTGTLLGRLLNKKITVCGKAHSEFKPTADNYKLEPDMSGGAKLIELVTGTQPYPEARITMIKILKWIAENGKTSDRCGIHMNISFNSDKYGQTFLSNLNVLKFILDFDEAYIYKLFPEREGSVYAKTVKYIVPREKYFFDNITNINPYNFIYPSEKYYGVNFMKLAKNYLEFRYLGGDKYETRIDDLLKLLDHFVLELYNSAAHPQFTKDNYAELQRILQRNQHLTKVYLAFSEFKKYYPTVGFLVDLDSDSRRIDAYWPVIRDKLYALLNECDLHDGLINYNSDTGRLQIKEANLDKSYKIENADLIDCKVKGVLRSCDIFRTEIQDAEIYECNLFNNSTADGCKLENCYTNASCKLIDCYVYGKNTLMNGTMKDGIFREGRITNLSNFENTELVEYEKLKTRVDVRH